MAEITEDSKPELSERERRFLERLVKKYAEEGRKPLLRSLLIFTALVTAGHLIEQYNLPEWGAFLAVYCPAIWLFRRYRRMSIFKSRLMRKLFLLEQTTRLEAAASVKQTSSPSAPAR